MECEDANDSAVGGEAMTAELEHALERLAIERRYLAHAQAAGVQPAIALAEAHIRDWEHRVIELRLADEGGWTP